DRIYIYIDATKLGWQERLTKELVDPVGPGPGFGGERRAEQPVRSPELVAMLRDMKTALSDEIDQIHRRERETRRKATNGTLLASQSGQYIYAFDLDQPWEPADDATIKIVLSDGTRIDGSVVNSTGMAIKIASALMLPEPALKELFLLEDPTWLYERLRDELDSMDGSSARLAAKAFKLPGFQAARSQSPFQPSSNFKPNESQKAATELSLGSEVAYIIGPPGTGKTSTLAEVAAQHVRAGRTVLIAAHTNIAVDNAILKLAEYTAGDQALLEGSIIRFGPSQTKAVNNHEYVNPRNVARRMSQDLERQRRVIENTLEEALRPVRAARAEQSRYGEQWTQERQRLVAEREAIRDSWTILFEEESRRHQTITAERNQISSQLLSLRRKLEAVRGQLGATVAKQAEWAHVREQTQLEEKRLGELLANAIKMSALERVVKRANPRKLASELAGKKQRIWQLTNTLEDAQRRMDSMHREIEMTEEQLAKLESRDHELENKATSSDAADKINALKDKYSGLDEHITTGDAKRQNVEADLGRLQRATQDAETRLTAQLADIEVQMAEVAERIVSQAQVVATTLTKAYTSKVIRERAFDVVIIDEISIAPLPAVFYATTRATQQATYFGDPYQLSPIATSNSTAAKRWLQRDLFGVAQVTLASAERGDADSCLLQEQFRMDSRISVIARKHVYDGKIIDAPNRPQSGNYDRVAPEEGFPLVLVDSGDENPTAQRYFKSKVNEYHIQCAMKCATDALRSLPTRDPKSLQEDGYRVGIVAPYNAQARRLQRAIREAKLDKQIRAGTIHKFQGLEFEVIVFDTVESPTLDINFLRGGRMTEAMRLVNVATTRPKHKLIIIANMTWLRQQLSSTDTLLLAVEEAARARLVKSEAVLLARVTP
ncbi:MAG TPA: AAA domain-containing protein, partial [Ktedonobacterales bacterium]|nr:AAA domain-containing protein [Ktedonobacterales bacterium]